MQNALVTCLAHTQAVQDMPAPSQHPWRSRDIKLKQRLFDVISSNSQCRSEITEAHGTHVVQEPLCSNFCVLLAVGSAIRSLILPNSTTILSAGGAQPIPLM